MSDSQDFQRPLPPVTAPSRNALQECIICLEPITSAGSHRIVALPCGHLMGRGCILQWISLHKSCPSCKHKVLKSQVISLFNPLVVLDNTFETKYTEQLLVNQSLQKQIRLLEFRLSQQILINTSLANPVAPPKRHFELLKSFRAPQTRILEFHHNSIYASYGSSTTHGMVHHHFDGLATPLPLHNAAVRDARISNNKLISTSLDKTLVISNLEGVLIHAFKLDSPGWSCCFDPQNPNLVYVGTSKNDILLYDTRTVDSVSIVQIPWNRGKGVHSLCANQTSVFGGCPDGIFQTDGSLHKLPDPLTSLDVYEDEFLVTCTLAKVTHSRCKLDFELETIGSYDKCDAYLKKSRILVTDRQWYCLASSGIFHNFQEYSGVKCSEYKSVRNSQGGLIAGVNGDQIHIWSIETLCDQQDEKKRKLVDLTDEKAECDTAISA